MPRLSLRSRDVVRARQSVPRPVGALLNARRRRHRLPRDVVTSVGDDDSVVLAIRRAATELPTNQLHKLASALAGHDSPTALTRHAVVNTVPTAIFRHHAAALCTAWAGEEGLPGRSLALAVRVAADAVADTRGEQQVSVVWTGPASYDVPVRATSAVLTDVIAEA